MFKFIQYLVSAAILAATVGCAAPSNTKSSWISHKVDATVTAVENRTVFVPPDKGVGVTDAAITGVAANNVGNSAVGAATLILGVLSDNSKGYYTKQKIVVAHGDDGKTYDLYDFEFPSSGSYKNTYPVAGDRVRILIPKRENGIRSVYNLTQNPELEEKTR